MTHRIHHGTLHPRNAISLIRVQSRFVQLPLLPHLLHLRHVNLGICLDQRCVLTDADNTCTLTHRDDAFDDPDAMEVRQDGGHLTHRYLLKVTISPSPSTCWQSSSMKAARCLYKWGFNLSDSSLFIHDLNNTESTIQPTDNAMFSFKTMKLSMLGRINLDSQETIVPRIVREKPRFGRKMSADKSSLFSDAIYQENLPLDCDGQDRHIWSDASIDHYVMTMIRDCGIAGELEHFVIEVSANQSRGIARGLRLPCTLKRRSSLKHGRTLIITPQDGDNISRLLKVFEEVVKVSAIPLQRCYRF